MSTGNSGRPLTVTQEQLRAIVPWKRIPDGTADEINAVVDLAGITTHLELAHFLGQCIYESGYFGYVEPYVPGRYEFNYKLGNNQPGDGQRYRGRGAIQLTGRYNYTRFAEWLEDEKLPGGLSTDINPIDEPEAVGLAPWRWQAAAFYWVTRGLRGPALQDDVAGCTRIITGARVPGPDQGLSSREKLTNSAIQVLG